MSTENEDEKIAFEKEIKELVKRVTEKARKNSMATTKNAWGNYLEENSNLKAKTYIRMYDRYVNDDFLQPTPSDFTLNAASKYIDFESFSDFCKQNFPEENRVEKKPKEEVVEKEGIIKKSKRKFNKVIVVSGITTILGLGSYFGLSANSHPQCMYWKGNSYEKVDCAEMLHPNVQIIPINEKLLEYLHKIEVSDTTTFFEAGKPVVWYLKVDGVIEFYSADGKHPINGKDLKPITPYILDKYIFNK